MTIKKLEIKEFIDTEASALNTFRTITLFGKNSATYKFALCHALMNQQKDNTGSVRSEVSYEDLQEDFLKEFVNHYKNNPNQFTKKTTRLTQSIDLYLKSEKTSKDWYKLNDLARQVIFNDVFRAFQNVGSGTIDEKYRIFEDIRKEKKIILTDQFLEVLESPDLRNTIHEENQARWSVVEEAWKAGLSPNFLEYNENDHYFYSGQGEKRIGLRSAVDTLLPYQKGRCFYCNTKVSKFVGTMDDDFADVDHFYPFSVVKKVKAQKTETPGANGVWNLVIACRKCNRGAEGKFDIPPTARFHEKLLKRNLLFVEEHKHSLKNSILLSLNVNDKEGVKDRMNEVFKVFENIAGWEPRFIYEAAS